MFCSCIIVLDLIIIFHSLIQIKIVSQLYFLLAGVIYKWIKALHMTHYFYIRKQLYFWGFYYVSNFFFRFHGFVSCLNYKLFTIELMNFTHVYFAYKFPFLRILVYMKAEWLIKLKMSGVVRKLKYANCIFCKLLAPLFCDTFYIFGLIIKMKHLHRIVIPKQGYRITLHQGLKMWLNCALL